MVNIIVIDDEPSAIKSMVWEIEHFCKEVNIIGTFTNALLAVDFLRTHQVDCVFLDIEMPNVDGFQFLEMFPNRNFAVVVTTAYDQYAIKAIKENALDYMLKPIDSDDMIECIEKLNKYKYELSSSDKLEKTLENFINSTKISHKKISINCDGKLLFINPEDIVYCESDGNYATIYLENKEKIFITQKLKVLEDKLIDSCFFRIHNSYLINLNKVKEFHKTDEYVVLTNNIKIPVSRNKKAEFLDRL